MDNKNILKTTIFSALSLCCIAVFDFAILLLFERLEIQDSLAYLTCALVTLVLLLAFGFLIHLQASPSAAATSYTAANLKATKMKGYVNPDQHDYTRSVQSPGLAAQKHGSGKPQRPSNVVQMPHSNLFAVAPGAKKLDTTESGVKTGVAKSPRPSGGGILPSEQKHTLRTNSVSRPDPTVKAIALTQQKNYETMENAALLLEVPQQEASILSLLTETRGRVQLIEKYMLDHLLTNEAIIKNLVDVRRVISALETRVTKLRELELTAETADYQKIRTMLSAELVVPRDAVNALIDAVDLPSLLPHEWDLRIDDLLKNAEKVLADLEEAKAEAKSAGNE